MIWQLLDKDQFEAVDEDINSSGDESIGNLSEVDDKPLLSMEIISHNLKAEAQNVPQNCVNACFIERQRMESVNICLEKDNKVMPILAYESNILMDKQSSNLVPYMTKSINRG